MPSIEKISKGVKVVALSRGFLRSASVALLIGRGSYADPVDGCACLANRMRLRLTSRLRPLQLQVALDRLGATVEATTERDLMLLRAQVPFRKVENCLKFLAELFTSPSFPASEVAREKTSQKLEYEKMRQDPMSASILDAWEATFPKNPLGHPVTGNPETIDKLPPKMLEKFNAETKENAPLILAIVAPQEEDKLIGYASSAFRHVKTADHVERCKVEPSRDFNVLRRQLKVKQTTFSVGVATRGITSSEYPALLCIEDHLGSERHYSGVLFKELRDKRGLTYFASSKLSALRDCGLLTAYAGAEHEKVAESIGLMLKCMAQIRDKPLPEKELREIKTFHRRAVGVMLEVPYQAATWLATNAFRGGKVDFESYMSDLEAVSADNFRNVARQAFTPSRMALSVAGGPPDEETLRDIMRRELE